MPVSAVVGRGTVLGVLRPGEHGSTFGGNPLACAVGREVVRLLGTGVYQQRARELGDVLHSRLGLLIGQGLLAVRGRGLWAGIDVEPSLATGREVCERLAARGVLAKDTHGSTIRLAPPLVIDRTEVEWAVDQLAGGAVRAVLTSRAPVRRTAPEAFQGRRRRPTNNAGPGQHRGMERAPAARP